MALSQPFQQENFDPRAWINKQLADVPRDALESTVNTLSLKLQVLGNELNTSFEDHIMQALAKLPMSNIDLDRMSREVTLLSTSLAGMLTPEVIQRQQEAEAATQSISKLHAKKTKLDQCLDTLDKTVYLNANVDTMDRAFKAGDTAVIASEIHKMQQALEAIEGYENHDRVAAKIAKYEEALQEMVEAECVNALINRHTAKAKEHLQTLEKIGRLNDALVQYTRQTVGPMAGEWKQFAAAHPITPGDPSWQDALVEFVKTFNGKLERTLAESNRYYTEVLGANARQVILQYYTMVMRDTAHTQIQYYSSLTPSRLVDCFTESRTLMRSLHDKYFTAGTDLQVSMLQEAANSPFAQLQARYSAAEEERLLAMIKGFRFVRELNAAASVTINPGLVTDIIESTSTLLQECEEAVGRCTRFTLVAPGDESRTMQLCGSINMVVNEFVRRVVDVATRLRRALHLDDDAGAQAAAVSGASPTPSPTSPARSAAGLSADVIDPVRLKICLQLHQCAVGVPQKLTLFQNWCGAHVAGLPPDPAAEALKHIYERAAARVFAEAAEEARAMEKVVETIVFDLLFSPVKSRLLDLPVMGSWAQEQESHYYAGTPLDYLRHVGDHLLSLPDTLGQASTELDRDDDYTWVVLVLKRTAEYFVAQVMRIPRLSDAGVKQLATDTEYLENVLSEFGQDIPALKALLLLSSAPADDYDACLDEVRKVSAAGEELHALLKTKRNAPAAPAPASTPSPH